MKWIIYALLLANLGFGLWHYRSQALSEETASTGDDDNLRLVLVKEYLAQQDKPPATGKTQTAASCYTLGPFKSAKDVDAVRSQLKQAGLTTKRRTLKDTSRKGFWVYLPPTKTRGQARAEIKELKAKGVTDYFLVVSGDRTNAVSLGVFAQSDTAKRRIEDIKAMGFKPQIDQVDLPRREYWLDWPVEQSLPPDLLDKINKKYDGIGQTTRNCS